MYTAGQSAMTSPRATRQHRVVAAAVLTIAALLATLFPASAAQADTFDTHESVVSIDPSDITPEVLDGRIEAIAVVGDTVIAGGTFTQVQNIGGSPIDQPYLFAFSRTTGLIDTNFDPVLNKRVMTLAAGSDDASVYVGGAFTTVNGQFNKKGLTKLDLAGDRITEFAGRTNGRVKDMVLVGDILYVGGIFSKIKGVSIDTLAALDATTGAVLPNIDLDFADEHSTAEATGSLSVDKIDATPDGNKLVVLGNFGSIDGQSRGRLAVIDTSVIPATVSSWNTDHYDVQCNALRWPQYVYDMDVSPDGTYLVAVSAGGPSQKNPACDTAVRFELDTTSSNVLPTWVDYSGGDSYFGVAVSGDAVYVGGHFRWVNNRFATNAKGPGGIPRRGIAALDALNGMPLPWRSDRSPRGVGVFELLVEDDGLWVGDDTGFMNGEFHPRIKFLPLEGGTPVVRPERPVLPTTVFTTTADSVDATSFDGTNLGAPIELLDGTWSDARGVVFLSGAMFYGTADGEMFVRSFDGTTLGDRVDVDLYGITSDQFRIEDVTGMYFEHDYGRIYYSLEGDSQLYYRYFTPDGAAVGVVAFEVATPGAVNWADVRGMDRIDDHLYYGLADGSLNRVDMAGELPVVGTNVVLSGPAIDGRDWSGRGMAFFAAGELFGPAPVLADFEFTSSATATENSWQTFKFPALAGEDVTIKLEWDDPTAQVNVFLRDETGTTVDADRAAAGTPKWLTANVANSGMWSVSVKVKSGAPTYDLLINPVEAPPAALAEVEFTSVGSATEGSWQVFKFPVVAGEDVVVQLDWSDPSAQLNVFLRDETGGTIVKDNGLTGSPKWLMTTAATSGRWSIAVKIKAGATGYNVLVNPV